MLIGRMLPVAAIVAAVVVALTLPAAKPATNASAHQTMAANSLTLYAQQDAWVDQETPTTNYGRDLVMNVGRFSVEPGPARHSLVQFDLSPLPVDAIVKTATLRLYQVQASGADKYVVYPDANFGSWLEREVNWNTKPPLDNIGDLPAYLDDVEGWKSWDITTMATAWASGGIENSGVQLRGDSETVAMRGFAAREDEKYQPMLVVEYALAQEAVLPAISNIRPSDWVTTTQAPTVYASALDAGSGISVTSASYRYSTNGGTSWSGFLAASVSGSNGVTTSQTMTATLVPFGADSGTQNRIEFRIADMNGNVGTAQGIVSIDTTPPTAPTSLASSHSLSNWSNDNTVDINWSGAADATSGIHGYSVSFSQGPIGVPDETMDTVDNVATSPALADAGNWYANARARDAAGNWSVDVRRSGPFRIDASPPDNPNAVSSSSHYTWNWSNNPQITMNWSGAVDKVSYVDGYSFLWDTVPSTLPDAIVDTWAETTTSPAMSSGNDKYFHLRTRDAAGNWSPTAEHRGPYNIDRVAPTSSAFSPATTGNSSFLVSLTGSDAHSGVATFDVQYRDMTTGGNWTDWLLNTAYGESTYVGENGHIYQFRSRARDYAGNLEAYPAGHDTQTSVANIDVWARNPGLEVNQAVQNLDNSVVLIAGKRTFVRAYVQSAAGLIPYVPASLTVSRGASVMGTLSPSNPGGDIHVRTSTLRSELNQSYYFDVPTGWLAAGSVRFDFEINPAPRKYAESDYANNARSVTVNFVNSPAMNLRVVDVPYAMNGLVHYPRDIDHVLLRSWLRRAYPINTLNIWWSDLGAPVIGIPDPILLNIELAWNKIRAVIYNGEDPWMRYYGMVSDTGDFMRGMSFGSPANVAAGPAGPPKSTVLGSNDWDFDASYADWYGGHEIGHSYERGHVWVDDADPECWAVGWPISQFPNPGGDISPTRAEWSSFAVFGLDAIGPTVIPPSWNDMMTYCKRQWISDFNYEGIYNRMVWEKPLVAAQIQEMRAAGVEHLAVMGSVITSTNTVTLSAFYRVPDGFDVFGRDANGQYHIRLLGNQDALLADYPFALRLGSDKDEPVGMISEMVPWITGTRKVAILHGATVLTTRNVSANAPTVAIAFPNGGETLSGSNVNVTWTANDADGDVLSYSLDYSRDGGVTWEPRSSNITTTQIAIDLSRLPGTTQGRFRVWASDGVNTVVDSSNGNFTVGSKPPTITSLAPASGQTYVVSQTVAFEGQASDAEDGLLPDNKLEWSSDLMGPLGTGQLLQTTGLITGSHTITLRATDSNGNVAQATTAIIVTNPQTNMGTVYQVFLPIILRGP